MQADKFKGCFVRKQLFSDLHGGRGFVVLRKLVQDSKVDELEQSVEVENTKWFEIENRGLTPPPPPPPPMTHPTSSIFTLSIIYSRSFTGLAATPAKRWMVPPLVHTFFDQQLVPCLMELMLLTKDHSLDLGP